MRSDKIRADAACRHFTKLCDRYWEAWEAWKNARWDLGFREEAAGRLLAVRRYAQLARNTPHQSRFREIAKAKRMPLSKIGVKRPR